jgi:hypothetical protein
MVQAEDKHAALLIPITVESAPDGNLMLPQCGKLMGQVTHCVTVPITLPNWQTYTSNLMWQGYASSNPDAKEMTPHSSTRREGHSGSSGLPLHFTYCQRLWLVHKECLIASFIPPKLSQYCVPCGSCLWTMHVSRLRALFSRSWLGYVPLV